MPTSSQERSPRERETLIYDNPEQGRQLREAYAERLQQSGDNLRREREVAGEQLADVFAEEGHAVANISKPWEHTPAEHDEAQRLVDLTFEHDLTTALKKAQQSQHYPRNLDLFHDVLTGEMYDVLREHRVNRQPLVGWMLLSIGFSAVVVLLLTVLILIY